MPRRARSLVGGVVYHVLNRACGRLKLFSRAADYAAFEKVLVEAQDKYPMRLLEYCLMPTHWHLVLWPEKGEDLSRFMFWVTLTHTQRWRHAHKVVGLGPLYQGRYRAFATQDDHHLFTMCRYVQQNAMRAGLSRRASDWQWGSLSLRSGQRGTAAPPITLHPWPINAPANWFDLVNEPQSDREVEALRSHIRTGKPFGGSAWQERTAAQLGINLHPAPRGRPRKGEK